MYERGAVTHCINRHFVSLLVVLLGSSAPQQSAVSELLDLLEALRRP